MVYYKDQDIIVRTSERNDVDLLKDKLRKDDINEIWASHHHTPENALRISFETSLRCFTIEKGGKPIGMFGVTPQVLLGDRANVWLLASDEIMRIKKSFIKQCRRFIKGMLTEYLVLENYIDARNKISIRWLKWCGAFMGQAQIMGIEQIPFHYFSFRRNR